MKVVSSFRARHTYEQYREVASKLRYDSETGFLYWTVPRACLRAGAKAGSTGSDGYEYVTYLRKDFTSHRLAWFIYYGELPLMMLDHKNGNKADNRISNLRLATPTENARNCRRAVNNKSGFKGVRWDASSKKFVATIRTGRKTIQLGGFASAEAAHAAYVEAAKIHHGEFYNSGERAA